MNTKQMHVAQTVTNRTWIDWKINKTIAGELSFSVMEVGDIVIVHGSNTDTTEWFEKQFIIQVFIGPRGGINKIATH